MSRTRNWSNKNSPTQNIYQNTDDLSFDSGSEENAHQFMAYFAREENKPELKTTTLNERHLELIFLFPANTFEINALAYYYGLFEPKDHLLFDPRFNQLFCFFKPEQLQLSCPEVAAFRDDLKKHAR